MDDDVASVLDGLDRIRDSAERLQIGLRQRQEDLLGLEDRIHDLSGHRHGGLVIVDQAEDIRRAVVSHVESQVLAMRDGLLHACNVLGGTEPGVTLRSVAALERVAAEAGRAKTHLDDVGTALGATSQASPTDAGIAVKAQRSVDLAAAQLESARRAVFQVVENLPTIIHGVQDALGTPAPLPAEPVDERPIGLDRLTTSVIAEMRHRAAQSLTTPEPGGRGPTL